MLDRTVTKDALFRTAREHGIPVPETCVPQSPEEVRAISAVIPYPCIIKPMRSNSWHNSKVREALSRISGGSEKAIVAATPQSLIDAYLKISEFDPDVVISEVIPGGDGNLLYFVFYRAADGRIWHFSGRKERITPVHFGSASYVVSIADPDLDRLCVEFLNRLDYRGLGGIEVKRDARDGTLKLIEFNTRFGLWDALGQYCGVDTAYVAYLDSIGEKLPEPAKARTGVKWISISRDFGALRGYRREGTLSARQWLRSLTGEKMWAVFAWDDPLPSITATWRFSRRLIRHLYQKVFRSTGSPRLSAGQKGRTPTMSSSI